MAMQFLERLQDRFHRYAKRPAIELPGEMRYTYWQLHQKACASAALLQSLDLQPGDRVILYLSDKHAFLLAHLGALFGGFVPLPLNPKFTQAELAYFAQDSGAAAIVCDRESRASAHAALRTTGAARCRMIATAEILAADSPSGFRPVDTHGDDPALMLYSSGTTGEPKGVVHTQQSLAYAVTSLADFWQFNPDDVLANVLPLFHIHGLSFATHVGWLSGGLMLVGERFHPRRSLDLIDRATVFMGVPPYYYSLLDRSEFAERAKRWSQLRLITCGSAPIRPEVLPQLQEIVGQPIINRYGMTESHVITSLPIADANERVPAKPGSVGIAVDGIEVRLVPHHEDKSPPLAAGVSECTATGPPGQSLTAASPAGEVHVRGRNLFTEYWNRPQATRDAFDTDGWFATGDLGRLDEDGYLTLVGRCKDLIIVGGYNVYPAVVERVVASCPGVREAAVFGLPDERRGQRVAAAVVPTSGHPCTAATVKQHCREKLIDYQCPSAVYLVDALPRNTMGKILRRELQQQFA